MQPAWNDHTIRAITREPYATFNSVGKYLREVFCKLQVFPSAPRTFSRASRHQTVDRSRRARERIASVTREARQVLKSESCKQIGLSPTNKLDYACARLRHARRTLCAKTEYKLGRAPRHQTFIISFVTLTTPRAPLLTFPFFFSSSITATETAQLEIL